MRAGPVFLAAAVLAGCEGLTSPSLLLDAQRMNPPAVYRHWWGLTEACAGITGDFAAVAWYIVPDAQQIRGITGQPAQGIWYRYGNRIVLAGEAHLFGDLVRHEMLHALLGRRHTTAHPRHAFVDRCGGVVQCDHRCEADGGPAPAADPNAGPIDPSQLEIGVEVNPAMPSSTHLDGHFTMVVTARNPFANPVVAQLPPSGDAGPGASFSYRLTRVDGFGASWFDMRAWVPEVTRFAPGETKRFVFDFRIGPGRTRYDIEPGTYRFDGAYGRVWAPAPPTVVVSP